MKLVPRSFYCDRKVRLKRKRSVHVYEVKKERERINSLRTHCGDNIRLLIDGNGDRELVSISTVTSGLFSSVFSRTCAELARGSFASYSPFVSVFADPHKDPVGSARVPNRLWLTQTAHKLCFEDSSFACQFVSLVFLPLAIQCLATLISIGVEYTRDVQNLLKECSTGRKSPGRSVIFV